MPNSLKENNLELVLDEASGYTIRGPEHAARIARGEEKHAFYGNGHETKDQVKKFMHYLAHHAERSQGLDAEVELLSAELERVKTEYATLQSMHHAMREALDAGEYATKTVDGSVDQVTRLSTGQYLGDAIRREVERSKRYDKPLSLVLVEIRNYGAVERYGQDVLDEVALTMKDSLTDNTRGSDLLARYGERHYAMLLPQTDSSGGRVVAGRVQLSFNEKITETSIGKSIKNKVTASCRISELNEDEGASDFVKRAVGGDIPTPIHRDKISYV